MTFTQLQLVFVFRQHPADVEMIDAHAGGRVRVGEIAGEGLQGPLRDAVIQQRRLTAERIDRADVNDRALPPLEAEDLVVFTGAGAYGAVMASEYNSRPLVPEVLVDGENWAVVRPRPTYEEMLDREPFADWL